MKPIRFQILFWALTIIELYYEQYPETLVRKILKPQVVFLIIIHWIQSHALIPVDPVFYVALLSGFVFSLLGDIFLIFQDEKTFFLLGLISFAIGHCSFIVAFMKNIKDGTKASNKILVIFYFVLFYTYGPLLLWQLNDFLGDMRAPVFFYAFLIVNMGITAFWRASHCSLQCGVLVAIGSIFFITSDSILSFSIFRKLSGNWVSPVIMGTYYIAEYLIMLGSFAYLMEKEKLIKIKEVYKK